ncbi:MAG TPA: PKD domain-containing protein [Verrucomicrobiae bacterium]|nr:PKD domain-containing protein [Verrucomicrobiae bacterium]
MNGKAILTGSLRLLIATVLCLAALSAQAQTNVRIRVMASNLTGDSQYYGTPEIDILQGLKADVVAIQEFQYSSITSNGVNTPAAIREMVDRAFGTNYFYFRENYTASGDIPNGVISRYPILSSGSFVDTQVANRGFAWAQIDLPGTNNLYIVSVHLLTSSSGARATEASNLTTLIHANFPSNAWIIVAGDFNSDSRSEACVTTFKTFLSDYPIPVDNLGNSNTSGPRSKPHDYVLPSFPMTNFLTSVVLPSHTFPSGLVFDSRVYTPLSDVPPVVSTDSDNAQHMGVFKDFFVLDSLVPGTLLSVTPVGGLSSSGLTGGPFNPTNQIYSLANSGTSNMNWAATKTAGWLTISPTNGTLVSGASTNVTVSINNTAESLSAGSYSDTVIFTNKTDGDGSTTRSVSLTVNATAPEIVTNGYALTAENCAPGNGVVDPGETVTVNLSVKNTGSADTSNLVATLVASSDVLLPSDPQTYGVVSTDGTPVSQPFTFTAGGTCGGTITATLQLQDGATDLGTIDFIIPVGVTSNVFAQNFDSVSAPSLPAGWTTSASGAQSSWVTSTTSADTAPNAAFSSDTNSVGINELDSPSIAINSSMAQLTFRQNYSLTVSSTNSALGYDGGVLEISIGGGSYTDILAAGGSFVSGGYNATLSGDYSNPLAGRSAWSGDAGGFVTTTVNLPAAASGQNIQLRWRCATGNTPAPVTSSGTLAFWNFDTLSNSPTTNAANLLVTPVTTNNLGSGATFTFFGGNPGSATAAAGFTTSASLPTPSSPCFAFSITVSNGAQADLSNLSFDDRASSTGPTKFDVQISQQANFSTSIFDSGEQNWHGVNVWGTDSFPLSLSNLTGTIYFRLYGYAAGAGAGTWRIDNLNIQGSVTSGGGTVGTGWYVDSVSVQDAFCCTNIPNPLLADFNGSPTEGAAPLAVTFDDASTGTITNWLWDFGDSSTTNVTTNSVAHTYAAGTYDVKLIVEGPDGVSTNTKPGYITAWTPFQTWQVQYFGSIDNPAADGSVDADGDGQNNLAEYLAGTDPTNSISALRITSVVRQGNDLQVTWSTGLGKTDALQFTTGTLSGSFSTNFADLFVVTNTTGTVTNYLDVGGATGATRYYRVRLVP